MTDQPAGHEPVVDVVDGVLVCPACAKRDCIGEERSGSRFDQLFLIEAGELRAEIGDAGFEHKRYCCNYCDATVALPQRLEEQELTYT